MNSAIKWIGGASLGIMALIGAAYAAGAALEPGEPRLSAEDVLAMDTTSDADIAAGVTLKGQLASQGDEELPSEAMADEARAEAIAHLQDDPFIIKRILPINGPIKYGEWHWDETGVPEDGELIITVDLQARVISVFRDGYEIGAAAVMLGTDEHPTPLGVFPILTKERHNVSEKYGNAPMPWTLRLTWDGIAIHGGSEVQNGFASHGCIGSPDPFVSKLFDIAKKGDIVIITDGKRVGLGDSLYSS